MGDILKLNGSPREGGDIINVDGKRYICAYWDGGTDTTTPDTIYKGQVVMIGYDNAASSTDIHNPLVKVPTTLAVPVWIAVAQSIISAAGWYWWQIAGDCEAKVDGGTADVTANDFLEVTNGTPSAFILDHASTRSVGSAAIAIDGNTNAAVLATAADLCTVHLIGIPVCIAAT